jgi:hypothetical protein
MEEKIKYFDDKFNDILKNSQFFMMNQTSDLVEENKFNHVSFVGNVPINDVLEQVVPMAGCVNNIVQDKYMQLFITREIFEKNNDVFKNNENGKNYVIIDDYSEIFNGFIRVDKYFILANSSIVKNKYNVYVLIDSNLGVDYTINNQNVDFEFYGFVKLGYLINQRGYTDEELLAFETEMKFSLRDDFKEYVKKTSIFRYSNKLFHINLDYTTYDNLQAYKLSQLFEYSNEKTITNNRFLTRYKNANTTDEYEDISKEENEYMDQVDYGCLYIGSLKKQLIPLNDQVELKSENKIYLLLNYNQVENVNNDFSIWMYSYNNTNFDNLLEKYENDKEINEEGLEYDVAEYMKKENITKIFKFMENITV